MPFSLHVSTSGAKHRNIRKHNLLRERVKTYMIYSLPDPHSESHDNINRISDTAKPHTFDTQAE